VRRAGLLKAEPGADAGPAALQAPPSSEVRLDSATRAESKAESRGDITSERDLRWLAALVRPFLMQWNAPGRTDPPARTSKSHSKSQQRATPGDTHRC
jgi:hypothetical protein